MPKPCQAEVFAILLAVFIGGLCGVPQRLQKRSLLFRYHKVENFSEIVTRSGYSAEEHSVITEDGYVLGVHRISGSPRSPPTRKKPTVLLLHGLGGTSDTWILQGPGVDLAFLLADEGFDVWCMNMRGNSYSRSHLWWSPLRSQFWRFSWHEGGVYDLPATIDHALDVSGNDKITLIGHSMGSTITFVLLSMRPEYNRRVDLVISLAPVAGFPARNQPRGPGLTIFAAIGIDFLVVSTAWLIEWTIQGLSLWVRTNGKPVNGLQLNGIHQLFSRNAAAQFVASLCQQPKISEICLQVVYFLFGIPKCNRLNVKVLRDVFDHNPAGISVDTLRHYEQLFHTEDFRLYDFGPELNLVRYGSTIPSKYPLERITAPVFLYYGLQDPFATAMDVSYLEKKLINVDVKVAKQVPHPLFSHLDFIFGLDSKHLLFDELINIMKNRTTSS